MRKRFYTIIIILFSVISVDYTKIYAHNIYSPIETETKLFNGLNLAEDANIGAWIIVAGDRDDDHALYYAFENQCNEIYEILQGLGYSAAQICYLAADWDGSLPSNAQGVSRKENIEWAITTWAADKVGSSLGLGIYLADHGGEYVLALPESCLSDIELRNYLETLESATGMIRSVVIIDACHSGSFLHKLSKYNRILISSTSFTRLSYFTTDLSNPLFSEPFWSAISVGFSIGHSFNIAKNYIVAHHHGYRQTPWLDDNWDGVPHQGYLPQGGDGYDAMRLFINEPLSKFSGISLEKCCLPFFISKTTLEIPIWVEVHNFTKIKYIHTKIIPWWWEWPEPLKDNINNISYFREDDFNLPYFNLTLNNQYGINNYSTSIDVLKYSNLFSAGNGDYKILFEAKTTNHQVADILATTLTINDNGNTPVDETPPTIEITQPSSNFNLDNSTTIKAKGDDNQALDIIKILIDGQIVEEENMPNYYPYPEVAYDLDINQYKGGEHNITAIAIDKTGNKNQTS
ncbi:MAG: C13 family peptidase, partial [Promethearchaeota archaeon]